MFNIIINALKSEGAIINSEHIDDICAISFPDTFISNPIFIHRDGSLEKTISADYYSNPIDVVGIHLPVFYLLANTLNQKGTANGRWSFIVDPDTKKGYFVCTYMICREDKIKELPEGVLSFVVKEFVRFVTEELENCDLSIERMAILSENDKGFGSSYVYACTLTTDYRFEFRLSDHERNRLLQLQDRLVENPELEDDLNQEDVEALEKLYHSQLAAIWLDSKQASLKIYRSLTNTVRNLRKLKKIAADNEE